MFLARAAISVIETCDIAAGGVPESRDARQSRDNLTQNLQPLRTEFRCEDRQPSSVTAGSRQTGDKSAPRTSSVKARMGMVPVAF